MLVTNTILVLNSAIWIQNFQIWVFCLFVEGPTYYKHCFLVVPPYFTEHDFIPLYNYHDKNICIKFNFNSLLYIVILCTCLVNLCSVEKWNKVQLNWIVSLMPIIRAVTLFSFKIPITTWWRLLPSPWYAYPILTVFCVHGF